MKQKKASAHLEMKVMITTVNDYDKCISELKVQIGIERTKGAGYVDQLEALNHLRTQQVDLLQWQLKKYVDSANTQMMQMYQFLHTVSVQHPAETYGHFTMASFSDSISRAI